MIAGRRCEDGSNGQSLSWSDVPHARTHLSNICVAISCSYSVSVYSVLFDSIAHKAVHIGHDRGFRRDQPQPINELVLWEPRLSKQRQDAQNCALAHCDLLIYDCQATSLGRPDRSAQPAILTYPASRLMSTMLQSGSDVPFKASDSTPYALSMSSKPSVRLASSSSATSGFCDPSRRSDSRSNTSQQVVANRVGARTAGLLATVAITLR